MPYGVLGSVGARRSRPGLLRPSAKRLPSPTGSYTLKINGVNVMAYLLAHSPKVKATGYSQNATFSFVLEGPTGTELDDIEVEQEVRWNDGTKDVFAGILRSIAPSDINRNNYVFLHCDAQAFNTYLDDNVVTSGNRLITAETDGARIKWLIDTFCTTGLTYAHVQDLAAVMPAFDYTGMTLNEAISKVLEQSRGSYFVDTQKDIHTFLNEARSAPFNVSDRPNNDTTFGYAPGSLTWPKDSVQLRNAIYAIPTAGGTAVPTWYTDAASIAYYGRREAVLRSSNKNQVDLDLEGNAVLASNRYPHGAGSFVCFRPGLEAGMDIRITSVLHGIWNQKFRIQAVTTTYPVDATGPEGSGPHFLVDFGDAPFVVKAAAVSLSAGASATPRYRVQSYRSVVLADTPTGWWKMDDADDTALADAMPPANNLPDYDGFDYHLYRQPAAIPGGIWSVAGTTFGQIVHWGAGTDGHNTINSVSDGPVVGPAGYGFSDNFTAEAWIFPTSFAYGTENGYMHGGIIMRNGAEADQLSVMDWGLAIANEGLAAAAVTNGLWYMWKWHNNPSDHTNGFANCYFTGYTFPAINTWYHVVMVRRSGTMHFFVNGVEVGTPTAIAPQKDEREGFSIGGRPAADPLNTFMGRIDEVAVYNHPLTDVRIAKHYSVGVSGPY